MHTYGLIGKQLSHSFSKKYFSKKFITQGIEDCEYLNFELENIQQIYDVIDKHRPRGFNVTIPYKESILPLLDDIDLEAKEIGAVNTIKVTYDSEGVCNLKGFNTDVHGFRQLIKPFFASHHERALILGTGGASKAVAFVLQKLGVNILYATRNPKENNQISYDDLNENVLKFHPMIVNTTPLGTYPNEDEFPNIPFQYLNEKSLLVDLVYNPEVTTFMKKGLDQGSKCINGLTMLHQQAEKSWEIFNS